AWAWGLHRCVDYLVTNRQIDKHRIFVVGHSRLGKTAIVAAAFDDRIAMAIPLQSGTGGAAPSRGNKQSESVTRINTTFPHWFNAEFKKFNDQPERLPFEQHCLIALCAPRPVLVGCAAEDLWANPAGQFEMVKAADNVYRLLGTDGFAATTMPAVNHVVDNTLGYFIRPGKHSMTKADWNVFLDYADKHFGKPK
ncbi:MAG: alpha/beta hydrolase family protein, partial [Limisphaerales bacterium]